MKIVHAVVLEDTTEEAELTDSVAETIQSLDTNGIHKKMYWDHDPFILGNIVVLVGSLDFSYIENLSRPRMITRNDEDGHNLRSSSPGIDDDEKDLPSTTTLPIR